MFWDIMSPAATKKLPVNIFFTAALFASFAIGTECIDNEAVLTRHMKKANKKANTLIV